MGRLLDHINSDEFRAEQEKREQDRLAEVEKDRIAQIAREKRYAENTIKDTLANLENDGWFNANRPIFADPHAYVVEHPSLPYCLVYYHGPDDYAISSQKDKRVHWHKCELIETSAYTVERLDGLK